MSYLG